MASSTTPEKNPKIRQVKDSCPSLTKMLKDLSKVKPTKTLKEMRGEVALMKSFLPNEKEARQLQDIPSPELDAYLSRFLLSVRKVW